MRRPSNLVADTPTFQPVAKPVEESAPASYLELYGLARPPFGAGAEAAGYILFSSHRRAFELLVEHMLNGSGGMLLSGEEGSGKTRMLRALADAVEETGKPVVRLFRPRVGRLTEAEIRSVTRPGQDGSPPPRAIVIDDVDLLAPEALAELEHRLAQKFPGGPAFVLSANPLARRPELAPLFGTLRNTVRLVPFTAAEVVQYIERCFWVAGATTRRLIAPDAMRSIMTRAGSTPGSVNRLMEAVLTAGFARGDPMITGRTVASVLGPAPHVRAQERSVKIDWVARGFQFIAILLFVSGASLFLYRGLSGTTETPAAVPQAGVANGPMLAGPSAADTSGRGTPSSLLAVLLQQGNDALAHQDVARARMFFQRAAQAGSAAAATALGRSYDPNFAVAEGTMPNSAQAADWYRKAIGLGDPKAADLLKKLGG